jgi:hypothetical protein
MHIRSLFLGILIFLILPISAQKTWNGNISSDWHDPLNWNPIGVPEVSESVTIGTATNQPVIFTSSSATAQYVHVLLPASLLIEQGAILKIDGNHLIDDGMSIRGTLENYGKITIENTKDDGIACFGLFVNHYGALITIDSSSFGIYLGGETFSNFGILV